MESRGDSRRLQSLDALRGIAALVVVYEHVSYHTLLDVRGFTNKWFSAGVFGVMLFFAISGYIIPASLERKGSIRSFWVSRLFRLYPLWIGALVAVIALRHWSLYYPHDVYMRENKASSLLAHGTMLQDLLGVPNTVNVMWTLSYEMVFYLLVTGLFVIGLHKFSAEIALLFAATALFAGGALPKIGISNGPLGTLTVVLACTAVFCLGLAAVMSGKRVLLLVGGVALALMALVLVVFNGRAGAWEGLLIPAYMFAGTAIYRAQSGQISVRKAWITVVGVVGASLAAGIYQAGQWGMDAEATMVERQRWVIAILAAVGLFALGLWGRDWPIPRALAWLGTISFSLYLLHPIFIGVFYESLQPYRDGISIWAQLAAFAVFVGFIIVCCGITYYAIEVPMQKLGRAVGKRWEKRAGSDAGLIRTYTGPGAAKAAERSRV